MTAIDLRGWANGQGGPRDRAVPIWPNKALRVAAGRPDVAEADCCFATQGCGADSGATVQ